MKVTNINGTSDNTCKCLSWLDHWKRYGGYSSIIYCPVEQCHGTELIGAHVQKESYVDRNWYIIPLCKTHNAEKGKTLIVSDSTIFVSANVSQTCGKK